MTARLGDQTAGRRHKVWYLGTKRVANALLPVYEAAFLNVAIGRS